MKNRQDSLIQDIYFRETGIILPSEDLFPLSCFANRSIDCSLSLENQQMFDRILKDFFSQLSEKQVNFFPIAKRYVSTACFYRFLKKRKFPETSFLRKLYFHGAFTFLKKSVTFVRRFIFES